MTGRLVVQRLEMGVYIRTHGRENPLMLARPEADKRHVLAVQFDGTWHDVRLPAGLHTAWIPAAGAGSSVRAKLLAGGPSVCVTSMSIGTLVASVTSQPLPAKPVPG